MTVVETRRLGEEEHATTEDKGEEEGQTQSDTPLSGTTLEVLGAQVDEVGEEDTEGDEELVATDDGTTDVTGGGFTLIHGNDQRTTTNAKTGDPATNDHLVPLASRRTDLNDQTDIEDETPESNGPFPTQPVGQGGTAEGTDQGTDGQQTDNQTGADRTESIGAIGLEFTITLEIVAHLLE